MECAILGPHLAGVSEMIRLDVVVRDLPTSGRLRIRLERLWPDPTSHIDECRCPASRAGTGAGTATFSFLWRPGGGNPCGPVVLRASVWGRAMLCASTHGVEVVNGPVARDTSSDQPFGAGRRFASA